MTIALVAAFRAEAAPLLARLSAVERLKVGGVRAWRANAGPHQVRLIVCGAGPERASESLRLAADFIGEAGFAVNFGVCGALDPVVELNRVVVMDSVAAVFHHQRRPIQLASLPATGSNLTTGGRLVTHSIPVFDSRVALRLALRFKAGYVDMEAWEVASFFRQHGVPCAVIKAVSDHADEASAGSFASTVKSAAAACAQAVHQVLLAL